MEKSDLKYPLIHGQGRQVSEWPPFKNPSSVAPPQRLELLCLVAMAGVLGTAPRPRVLEGHSPPLCFTCTFAGVICCDLTSPLSPGSVIGNTGRLPGPGRPSAQSLGHKHSAEALLALCPTGERATAHPSFHLPRRADNEAGGSWEGNTKGSSDLTCR